MARVEIIALELALGVTFVPNVVEFLCDRVVQDDLGAVAESDRQFGVDCPDHPDPAIQTNQHVAGEHLERGELSALNSIDDLNQKQCNL